MLAGRRARADSLTLGKGKRRQAHASAGAIALGMAALVLADLATLPPTAEARPGRAYSYGAKRLAAPHPDTVPPRKPDGPINVIISIASQRLWVYDKQGLIDTSIVSTGTGGFPTPTGVFAVIDKSERHFSNIYGGAPMPFMQRLTMSGVALHSGVTTGRPASHGCIRMPHNVAVRMFKLTGLGARVIITPDAPTPQEIAHPNLFVRKEPPPEPGEDPKRVGVAAATAGHDLLKGAANAGIGKITAWRASLLQVLPVSVFVSKVEGKVFVRHGFRSLFEAPAIIKNPERRLGTHVYTALELKDDTGLMRWFAVSVADSGTTPASSRKVSKLSRSETEPMIPGAGPPSSAAEALDRFEIPEEARDRIARFMSPGVTLIVSDHGHNREMRSYGTDFIVLTP
jgi:hypothetical protein